MGVKERDRSRGQAAVELAILGSLILLAVSTLLIYGQRLELQQQLKMEAFRKALQKAYQRNSSVTYTLKKDSRFFNLMAGFGQGQASTLGASASAMWQKGAPGASGAKGQTQASFAYYQINDEMVGIQDTGGDIMLPRYNRTTIDSDGAISGEMTVPVSVYKEERVSTEDYSSSLSRQEAPLSGTRGKINATRSADLKHNVTTRLYTRKDISYSNTSAQEPGLPSYSYTFANNTSLSSTGAYYNASTNRIEYSKNTTGNVIHRQRSWETVFEK